MTSLDLVQQLENNERFTLSQIRKEGSEEVGVYGMWEEGKLIYVGESSNSIRHRVGKEHSTGSSCTSSFCNYLRAHKGIVVTPEERSLFSEEIPTVKIEELKLRDFLERHVTCSYVEIDPKELLEDVSKKPEDFLFEYYKQKEVNLLNNPTKRSREVKEELSLENYRKLIN